MINTEKFTILPLIYKQLVKYLKNDNSLEFELKLNPSYQNISDELKEALEQVILPNVADKNKNYLYSTIWTAISKKENKIVGSFCFYGEPNEIGELEIGYGAYDEFQGKGIMTEIVKGAIEWAKTQNQIKGIKASTEKANFASFKVLEKNGFVQIGENENLLHWLLKLK